MNKPFSETGIIVRINFKLLYAFILACSGYFIWPTDPRWWSLYLLSVLMIASAFGLLVESIREAIKLNIAKKRWAEIMARGNAPKNAKLASIDDLRKKGMI